MSSIKLSLLVCLLAMASFSGLAYADCTTPAGVEGEIIYNSTAKMLQFCNGTNWIDMAYYEISSLWQHIMENWA